jgi:hypothetical protein
MTGNRVPENRGDPHRGELCLGGRPLGVRPFLVTAVAVRAYSPYSVPEAPPTGGRQARLRSGQASRGPAHASASPPHLLGSTTEGPTR